MQWIKQIIVDLFALAIIAVTVFSEQIILTYVVYVYTFLMAAARLFSLFSGNFRAITERKVSEAPLWVYHLIYGATVAVLLAGGWYVTGVAWILIWFAAAYAYKKRSSI
jgi:hypothetical protein